jgi:hypothetical protein
LLQGLEDAGAAGVAAFFFEGFEAAELEAGATLGFLAGETGADEVFGVAVEVVAEFGVHVAFGVESLTVAI